MQTIFYSAATGGFYDSEIHGDAIPDGAFVITAEEHAALLAGQSAGKRIVPGTGGEPALEDPPEPTEDQVIAMYTAAMDRLFDVTAQAKRYDNRVTCALRAGYPGPFQAEGLAFAQWMDECNALGYSILAEVKSGAREQPTVGEFIDLLPPMVWPQS